MHEVLREHVHAIGEDPEWRVEQFIFDSNVDGSSYETYRHDGARLQKHDWTEILLTDMQQPRFGNTSFGIDIAEVDYIGEFVATHEDCRIELAGIDSSDILLIGWSDVKTPEDISLYERCKAASVVDYE